LLNQIKDLSLVYNLTTKVMIYDKPKFTEVEIATFEKAIDNQIKKGNFQISISSSFISDAMQRFQTYLGFHYPSGSFVPSGNRRNYRIAKKGKKYAKQENW